MCAREGVGNESILDLFRNYSLCSIMCHITNVWKGTSQTGQLSLFSVEDTQRLLESKEMIKRTVSGRIDIW
jgi:hypothetical protein